MKRWFAVAGLAIVIFSCRKEVIQQGNPSSHHPTFSIQSILADVKDSVSQTDFDSLDTGRYYTALNGDKKAFIVRIAFKEKDIANEFVLLRVDGANHINEGKIIRIDKDSATNNEGAFNGTIAISSLDRQQIVTEEVENGRWKETHSQAAAASMKEEEPAGEQDLPPVVVTSHSYNGSSTGDWYLLDAMFDADGTGYDSGGSSGYPYTLASGGTSVSNGASTMMVEEELNDLSGISVKDYFKCFDNISDSGASYSITLYTDIPVDNEPSKIFNWSTLSPGHTFIQLNKTSGSATVQQILGFYPATSFKALGQYPTESKIVDNTDHEYNASLTQALSSAQFQAMLDKIEAVQYKDYDLEKWNCTDFALSVFNASTYNALTIPQYKTEGSGEYMNTPQGVYTEIQVLKASGNTTHGSANMPAYEQHAGKSHGSCNDNL